MRQALKSMLMTVLPNHAGDVAAEAMLVIA
jgi:hypothetical protein